MMKAIYCPASWALDGRRSFARTTIDAACSACVLVPRIPLRRHWQPSKTTNPENGSVFPGSAVAFASLRGGGMLRQGFEPPRENAGKTVISEGGGPTDGPEAQRTDLEAIKAALAALSPERLAEVLAAAIQSGAGMR